MKQKILLCTVATMVLAGSSFAQSTRTTTTTTEETRTGETTLGTGTSYGTNTYQPEHSLRDETFGFSPQFGVVTYQDATGEATSRAITGIGIDFNVMPAAADGPKEMFLGLSTGGFYSHLGSSAANFWGANDEGNFGSNANMVIIPANLKWGFNATDNFRASLRGGGNLIYRSASFAANLGEGSDSSDSSWKMLPNVGVDLEWQVGDNVAIIARPDFTIRPGSNMFVGTLGATIMPSF